MAKKYIYLKEGFLNELLEFGVALESIEHLAKNIIKKIFMKVNISNIQSLTTQLNIKLFGQSVMNLNLLSNCLQLLNNYLMIIKKIKTMRSLLWHHDLDSVTLDLTFDNGDFEIKCLPIHAYLLDISMMILKDFTVMHQLNNYKQQEIIEILCNLFSAKTLETFNLQMKELRQLFSLLQIQLQQTKFIQDIITILINFHYVNLIFINDLFNYKFYISILQLREIQRIVKIVLISFAQTKIFQINYINRIFNDY